MKSMLKTVLFLALCGVMLMALPGLAAAEENLAAEAKLYESVWYGAAPTIEGDTVTVTNVNGGYGFAQFTTDAKIAEAEKLIYSGVLNVEAGEIGVSCANLIFACQPGGPDHPGSRWQHCNFNLGIKFDVNGNCCYVMLAGGSGVWVPMKAVACTVEKGKDIPYTIVYEPAKKYVEFYVGEDKLIATELTAEAFGNNPIFEEAWIDALVPCVAFGSDHSTYTVSGLKVVAEAAEPAVRNVLTELVKDDSAWGGDAYVVEGDTVHIIDKTVYGYLRMKLDIEDLTDFTFKGTFTIKKELGNLACINVIYLGVPSPDEARRWAGANSHQAIKLDMARDTVYFIAEEGSGNWTTSEARAPFKFEEGKAYNYELQYKDGYTTFSIDGETLLSDAWTCDSTEYMLPQLAFGGATLEADVTNLEVLTAQ